MMKMLLKKLNIVADTAENGRIALDMIMGASEPYHLVFMDNLMPEMVVLLPLPLPLLPSHPISKALYITYG
jgi:CheY-like chemotaxis protein